MSAFRRLVPVLVRSAVTSTLLFAFGTPAAAQCSSPYIGRWYAQRAGGDPEQIEVYFASCGDTGGPTRIGVKVFVRQSTGGLYQRPAVHGSDVVDKGKPYLFAKVPTGGYLDKMWMNRSRVGDADVLKVFIRHESLDSKPSAQEWIEYRRTAPAHRLDVGGTRLTDSAIVRRP